MIKRRVFTAIWTTFLVLGTISICSAQEPKLDESKLDATSRQFLKRLRANNKKPQLAEEFESRLVRAINETESYKKGHVIMGRIVLDGGKEPRMVSSQMLILEDGYFVDAIGVAGKPLGFRLHGFEAVNVTPKGPGPFEQVGNIKLKPLPFNRLASAKLKIHLEKHPDAPKPEQVVAKWSIGSDPINTPHNGTEGVNPGFLPKPIESKSGADGTLTATGMSPARYYLAIEAPNCVRPWQYVDFKEGEKKVLEPILVEVARKMDFEYLVATGEDFKQSTVEKKTLAANDLWLIDKNEKYGYDLKVEQKDRRLKWSQSHGGTFITDLGAATLAEKLGAGPAQLTDQQAYNAPPIEEGHVYLVHLKYKKRWALFRATTPK